MSLSLSSSLYSLYPRETNELSAMLARHGVPVGSPADIHSLPSKLAEDPTLQGALAAFIQTARTRLGGPVSLDAMLHLIIATVGGPGAASLGPEADQPISLLTSFLESTGYWPEHLFTEQDAGVVPAPAPQASRPPGRQVRSIAASLASQATEPSLPWRAEERVSFDDIADRLTQLEQNQIEAARRLDSINEQLLRMQESRGAPAARSDPDPATTAQVKSRSENGLVSETGKPVHRASGEAPLPPMSIDRADTSTPLAPASDPPVPQVAVDEATQPRAVDSSALELSAVARDRPLMNPTSAAEVILSEPAEKTEKPTSGSVSTREAPTFILSEPDYREPTPEWKKLFSAPEQRSRSPVRLVIVTVVVLLAILAALAYLRARSDATSGGSDVSPAPVPAAATLPERTPLTDQPAAGAHPSTRSTPSNSGALATAKTDGERTKDRVLGARERLQTQENGEDLEPNAPVFVSAAVMDSHLVYAPKPEHPRVAGLGRLAGMVVLDVVVDARGYVDEVHVLGGHHLLRDAAVNAVRTWRYRPIVRNGQAIPVRTTVRIDFSADGADTAAN